MADYSLDDYIHTGGSRLSGRVGNRLGAKTPGGIKGRLGEGRGRGRGRGAGGHKPVTITGVGQIRGGFDARQKLNKTGQFQDARQKIQQKTTLVDARIRIQNKQKSPSAGAAHTKISAKTSPNDMRIKLNNAMAKKSDARQMIQARKQAKEQQVERKRTHSAGGSVSMAEGGSLQRTIPGNQGGGNALFQKTIQNQRTSGQDHSNLISVRISNEPQAPQVPQHQSYGYSESYQQPYQSQAYADPHLHMPVMQVRNDMYQAQPPAPQPTAIHYQPAYQQHDNYPEDPYTSPPAPPPAASASLRPRQRVKVSKPVTPTSAFPSDDVVSPLQGSSVLVSNLHLKVSQDDVIELFGVVGALKKARLLKPGTAEVVFVKSDDSHAAIRKYHMRELDGQPMHVKMSSHGPPPSAPKRPPSPQIHQPLKLNKPEPKSSTEGAIDPNLIHRALFKSIGSKQDAPSKPVTFTVKI